MAVNKLQKKWSGKILDLCAFSTGLIAVVFLLLIIRESIAAYGNQEAFFGLIPALWLYALAYGARLIRYFLHKDTLSLLLVSHLISIPVLILAILITRLLPVFMGLPLGTTPPLLLSAIYLLLTILPMGIISGFQSSLLNLLHIGRNIKEYPLYVNRTFQLEILGALSGASLYIVFGTFFCYSFQILVFLTLLIWSCLAMVVSILIPTEDSQHRKFWGTVALIALFFFSLMLLSPVSGMLEKMTLKRTWNNCQLMRTAESAHGRLAFTISEHELTVFADRYPLFSTSEKALREEKAHIPVLAAPQAVKNILMVGGGLDGTLEEFLKYASVETIDYLEVDRALLRISREYLLQFNFFRDKRVQLRTADPQSFLQKTSSRYDLILVEAAPLTTLMFNRFASQEFCIAAKEKLTTAGIMAIMLPATSVTSTISLSESTLTILSAFQQVFPHVLILPASRNYFIGSAMADDPLTNLDGSTLAYRMYDRQVRNGYLTAETLPGLLTAEKMAHAQQLLTIARTVQPNRIMTPYAYFSALTAWLISWPLYLPQLISVVCTLFIFIVTLASLFWFLIKKYTTSLQLLQTRRTVQLHGFSIALLSTLIYFALQVFTGTLYFQICTLTLALLAGIYWGSVRTAEHIREHKNLRTVLSVAAVLLLIPSMTLNLLTGLNLPFYLTWLYSMVLTLLILLTGNSFGRAYGLMILNIAQQEKGEPGLIAANSIAVIARWAALGTLVTTIILLPALGFPATALIATGFILVTILYSL